MQVVIDIPEETYERIKDFYKTHETVEATYSYIVHGTPLPKGHGRLIDADLALKKHCADYCRDIPNCEEDCAIYDTFNHAPTVLEADKESAE